MIKPDKRKAIYLLHEEGVSLRRIARQMHVTVNSVRTVIEQKGELPETQRKDKVKVDPELLERLYHDCDGRLQRVHEKLTEEHQVTIGYSTLTERARALGLGSRRLRRRCDQVPDVPGEEMQHDTTVYMLRLGDRKVKVVASLIYFRYSKIRYLKFYRAFNRFAMKCFLHEALTFWGYSASVCIIDNTNLARLSGIGRTAVIVPEMEAFAAAYGFSFFCHERNHPDRKAGNERGFYTTETNFLPGRTFTDLEDLNAQAIEWATQRMAVRPVGKARVVPMKMFEHEQPHLNKLPGCMPGPYQVHSRITDQYGYIAFKANYYWVPGTRRDTVKVLEYSESIQIWLNRKQLTSYDLPPDGVTNEKYAPKGMPKSVYQPKNRKKSSAEEENRLRKADPEIDLYLSALPRWEGQRRHRFIRELHALSRKVEASIFVKTVARARAYRITDMQALKRMAVFEIHSGMQIPPDPSVDETYDHRKTYIEGRFTDPVDLSIYDDPEDDDTDTSQDDKGEPENEDG